jgi:hypothetical protein
MQPAVQGGVRCAECGDVTTNQYVVALGKNWHPVPPTLLPLSLTSPSTTLHATNAAALSLESFTTLMARGCVPSVHLPCSGMGGGVIFVLVFF